MVNKKIMWSKTYTCHVFKCSYQRQCCLSVKVSSNLNLSIIYLSVDLHQYTISMYYVCTHSDHLLPVSDMLGEELNPHVNLVASSRYRVK